MNKDTSSSTARDGEFLIKIPKGGVHPLVFPEESRFSLFSPEEAKL